VKASLEQRQGIFKLLGYKPTKEQEEAHFADLYDAEMREKWISGGEQSGKSFASAKETMSRCMVEGPDTEGTPSIWWLAGSDYNNAKKEFEYCMEDAIKLSLIWNKREHIGYSSNAGYGQCVLKLCNGAAIIKTISLKDLHRVGQESPSGIVICEAAQVNWDAVQRCRTRVAAARGWLLYSGTIEGSLGWYAQKVTEYQASNPEGAKTFFMPSWSNIHRYPEGREDSQIKHYEEILPEDIFNERFAGKPCSPSNIILREFKPEAHIGDFAFKSDLPVDLAVDPGGAFKSGAYAILVIQEWAGNIYVVDEIYLRGYVTEEIIDPIVLNKPWWKNVRGGVIDIAAKQHHTVGLREMSSDTEIWQKKTGLHLRTNKIEEAGGIDRLRTFLKIDPVTNLPHLFVNRTCKGLISEAGGGKSPIENGGPWLRDKNTGKPMDKNNHAAKALYYWLVGKYGYIRVNRAPVGVTHQSPFI